LHCDTIYECEKQNVDLLNRELQFSLDKLPEQVRLCQCMAIFMPDDLRGEEAERCYDRHFARFRRQLELYPDRVAQVTETAAVSDLLRQRQYALMLTVEGGSALAGKLDNLYKLQNCGVKMMTLTWNAANEICGGAATDKGFTPFGLEVVALMEELGMAVDVSHLSDKGFYELCAFAKKPFVASHSNSRAVCGHRRNLTDDMFRQIAERGGLVGINYYREFIVPGGVTHSIDDLLRHVHHFLELGGEDVLALGSDMDGVVDIHPCLRSLDQVPRLRESLCGSGISAAVADKILFENAQRFFARLHSANEEN